MLVVLLLCGCTAQKPVEETQPPVVAVGEASQADIDQLETLYAGREIYYGNLHDHSASGDPENDPYRTADGKTRIELWPAVLASKELDFVALVDHRQSRHMRLDCWDETMFIGATETSIHRPGDDGEMCALDYNILMNDVDRFEEILASLPFNFNNGYFKSPYDLTDAQLAQLLQMVRDAGGTLVHVHPCMEGYLQSSNPLDYYFGEYTGIEVLNSLYGVNMTAPHNQAAYNVWVALLNMGKHVYAFAGSDSHTTCDTISASTVYAEERLNTSYLRHVVNGDFTAGPVGIRMCIGDTTTGGETDFTGKRLVISVGDFHPKQYVAQHQYRLRVYNESGMVFQKTLDGTDAVYVALDTENCKYYRAEIYNATGDFVVALGNPIWNSAAS